MANEYCHKGDLVGVLGRIQTGSYEKDDKKVYTTEIIIDKLNFLSQAKKTEEKDTKEDPYEVFSKENKIEDLPF